MSENKTETKSISEIMEMLDYSLDKVKNLREISKSIIVLGNIDEPYARKILAQGLSKQLSEAEWGVELAGRYIDDLEATLDNEVPTIDEDTTEDDLPFVSPVEDTEDVRV